MGFWTWMQMLRHLWILLYWTQKRVVFKRTYMSLPRNIIFACKHHASFLVTNSLFICSMMCFLMKCIGIWYKNRFWWNISNTREPFRCFEFYTRTRMVLAFRVACLFVDVNKGWVFEDYRFLVSPGCSKQRLVLCATKKLFERVLLCRHDALLTTSLQNSVPMQPNPSITWSSWKIYFFLFGLRPTENGSALDWIRISTSHIFQHCRASKELFQTIPLKMLETLQKITVQPWDELVVTIATIISNLV